MLKKRALIFRDFLGSPRRFGLVFAVIRHHTHLAIGKD
jgi:hypothetical protein